MGQGEVTTSGNGHRKRGRGVKALIPDLAEGSHQGNERTQAFTTLVDPDLARAALAQHLESCEAQKMRGTVGAMQAAATAADLHDQLDHATLLLRQLVGALARQGGYMLPEDQDALRAARRFLVDRAK